MPVTIVDHPLVADRLAVLRDARTATDAFRSATTDIAAMLAYEAARGWPTVSDVVDGPLESAPVTRLASPPPVVVPILRAGMGMLSGVLEMIPAAEVAVLGMRRDETTLEPTVYADSLPVDLSGRVAVVCDPMLATGGSMARALSALEERGVATVVALCLLASAEGIARVLGGCPRLDLYVAALDGRLDGRGFIRPGLGDAGDRLYGP